MVGAQAGMMPSYVSPEGIRSCLRGRSGRGSSAGLLEGASSRGRDSRPTSSSDRARELRAPRGEGGTGTTAPATRTPGVRIRTEGGRQSEYLISGGSLVGQRWRLYVVLRLRGRRSGVRLGVWRLRRDRVCPEFRYVELRWFL